MLPTMTYPRACDRCFRAATDSLGHRPEEVFASADTPADYITDLGCAVVEDVLLRDPGAAAENERRLDVAAQSLRAGRSLR